MKQGIRYIDGNWYIDNRVYSMNYSFLEDSTLYLKHIFINHQYQGRGYLKRILDGLVKKYKCGIVFECFGELMPMYLHIGCFCTLDNPDPFSLREMYYDPLNKMF